jgi:hypothetical protein
MGKWHENRENFMQGIRESLSEVLEKTNWLYSQRGAHAGLLIGQFVRIPLQSDFLG